MIKVSVLYPNEEGKKFDMDYYTKGHIAMVQEFCGEAIKGLSVEQGLSRVEPGTPPIYVATAHFLFDSVEDFMSSWGPHVETLRADIPNYTDIQPIIQIGEVKMS